ncbi:hypothetical protein ACLKA7_013185 [Drosophila subpalustris]
MRWTLFALFAILVAARATANKIVINGVCTNCVTNRPVIGPETQGYEYEQQGAPGYPQTAPQPGYATNYNNVANRPQQGFGIQAQNGPQPGYAPNNNNAPNRPQQGFGIQPQTAPQQGFATSNNNANWGSSGNSQVNLANGGPQTAPSNVGNNFPKRTVNQLKESNINVFSGRLPDGTYVHNGPCTNCRIVN